jgi:hypothetical protein
VDGFNQKPSNANRPEEWIKYSVLVELSLFSGFSSTGENRQISVLTIVNIPHDFGHTSTNFGQISI